ncbi:hypothetical protein [Desulfosporosinus sp.]|nr:hypothetical protein [Desulfosporosinus sp.]
MPHPSGIPLAAGYISETVAWAGHFLVIQRLLSAYNPSSKL